MKTAAKHRALALAGAAPALLALLAGCGIRGTAVPVDAGPAPSRASCVVRSGASPAPGVTTVTVQLECTSQLVPVTREVTLPRQAAGDPVAVARVLLEQLQRTPAGAEAEAGLTTAVPSKLTVGGPRAGDPAGTLRLARDPDELPQVALAQLVCTFAGTAAAKGGQAVLLGGPDADRPKSYRCTEEMRGHPDTAEINTSPVS
ncbi:hypothetical protein ACFP1Z_02410 [Streptomyces gamaensis]|uniref:Lipoprotein n=1 Tax=Streptomyces gamaensis TaxID=1763542 RepID=A0ABW0YX91_9ACTN